jgi:hypothetical protein
MGLEPTPKVPSHFMGKRSDIEARAHWLHNLNHIAMLDREEYDIVVMKLKVICERSKFSLPLNKCKIIK